MNLTGGYGPIALCSTPGRTGLTPGPSMTRSAAALRCGWRTGHLVSGRSRELLGAADGLRRGSAAAQRGLETLVRLGDGIALARQ
jgi:hypothetical protein